MTTDDGTSVLAPKCLAWFSPGVRYSLRTPQTVWLGRFRFRLWKGGALLRMWTQAKPIPGVMRFGEICRLLYEEHRIVAPYADERFRALVAELTISALRAMQQDNDERRLTHYQATRLLDYVSDRVAERTTPAELAALLRLSPAYFARLFRRSFGVSARRWIVEERMRHAARLLLDTDDNVGEIARLLGYNDQHFFSRQFRSVHRLSPMAYRRAHQTEE
jgi:AraC-like DNA-binding protein